MSFSNQYSHGKRKSSRSRYAWLAIILMLVMVSIAAVFSFKQVRHHPEWSRPVAEYYGRAATWVAERKQRLRQTAAAVKKNVEVSNDPERVVNFEFYNTLEDMQSMQVSVDAEAAATKNLAQKVVTSEALPKARVKKPARITQAADLENDLLATMKQQGGGKTK